ncbi:MAG: hypothetical protein JWN45_3515, partial [Acidobacteriaceae bacterium]|nr:hypothetical protein [Acidobacteriaceae bacterium]
HVARGHFESGGSANCDAVRIVDSANITLSGLDEADAPIVGSFISVSQTGAGRQGPVYMHGIANLTWPTTLTDTVSPTNVTLTLAQSKGLGDYQILGDSTVTTAGYSRIPVLQGNMHIASGNLTLSPKAGSVSGLDYSPADNGSVFRFGKSAWGMTQFELNSGTYGIGLGVSRSGQAGNNNLVATTGNSAAVSHAALEITFGGVMQFCGQAHQVDGTILALGCGTTIDTVNGIIKANKIAIGGGTTIAKYIEGTITQDVGSISANMCTDTNTITVAGAIDGDAATVGVPAAVASTAGLQFSAYVSSANTAKVRVCNVTTRAIDPASTTYRVGVWVH